MAAAQHICHLCIRIYKSLLHIGNKHDHIRGINGDLRLLSHLRENDVSAVRLNSTGIDHGKGFIQPGYIRIDSVTGNSRCIFYN